MEIANDTVYGLSAHVQGGDVDGARAVAARLRCGQAHINYPAWDHSAPFGATGDRAVAGKRSEGLDEYLEAYVLLGFG